MPAIQPRGPLPARVYWTRRAIVLLVPLFLVIGLARVLGAGSDASDGDATPTATQAGATTTSETVAEQATEQPAEKKRKKRKKPAAPATPVLPDPSGPCTPSDITATPVITQAPGGAAVPITLNLRTISTPACTWQVSPDSLTLKITSGSDLVWRSSECPTAIPTQDVVVRQMADTPVVVTWDARRSDEGCTEARDWARPGYYHVNAAALGGEPTDVQFELVPPTSAVVTKTVTPKPEPQGKGKKGRTHEAGDDGEGVSEPNG